MNFNKNWQYGVGKRFFSLAFQLACTVLLAGAWNTHASNSLRFERPLEGLESLSHRLGGINSIVQDHQGFIWLGGESGLGRFDGQTIKHYPSRRDLPDSLPSNYIESLIVDRDKVMWVASGGGLSRFNRSSDNFETLRVIGGTALASGTMSALAVTDDNTLYLGGRQLYKIAPDRLSVQVYNPNPPLDRPPDGEQIRDIDIAPDGKIWLATDAMGVAIFDPDTETFEYLIRNPDDINSLSYNRVGAVEIDRAGRVWIGTYGRGISVYYPEEQRFHHFSQQPGKRSDLGSGFVWSIAQDSEGHLWAALDQGGLARFDEKSFSFEHFVHDPLDPNSLGSNQLRTVYEDRNTDLWIGVFPSGVSYYNRAKQLFRTYKARPGDPTSLTSSAITSLLQDRDGTVWVGTEGGLNAYDDLTDTFKQYRGDPQNPEALQSKPVLALEQDHRGDLWVGTWAGGLYRFDQKTERFRHYSPDNDEPENIESNFIWSILEDSANNLWVGTEAGGLRLYNPAPDGFTSHRHRSGDDTSIAGNFIWAVMEDSHKQLWISTFTGVDIFDHARERFYRFPRADDQVPPGSTQDPRSLYEDSRGLIWIGTQDQGVTVYNPSDKSSRQINEAQGLPPGTVSSILEDTSGVMWLASTNGLVRVEYPALRITTYGKEHGLAGSSFNRNASLRDRQGNLYFGSTEGLTVFHPDDLSSQIPDFPVRLTEFRILNQKVPIGPESPLAVSIVETEEIILTHKDVMFSFDFAALNYRNPSSNRYAYMLEGFDRDWNYINTSSSATYTNIDPGTYTFRVMASAGNDNWNTDGVSVKLVVVPPPWRSWWAYLGYVGLAGIGLYFRNAYQRVSSSAQSYKTKSITDPLTGLYNRAGISEITQGLFFSTETRKDTAIMVVDIDHFKRINDRRGHDAGDRILKRLTDLMLRNVRRSDYVGRWGGEEFILLCPSVTAASAQGIAEKMRRAVEDVVFEAEEAPLHVTISIGVAIVHADDTFDAALKRADVALYEAKAIGRNCVCVADTDEWC